MNNERAPRVAIEICRILDKIRKGHLLSDFEALRFWAENADYNKWFVDPVGRIPGVAGYLSVLVDAGWCRYQHA